MSDSSFIVAPVGPVLHAPAPNESRIEADLWQWQQPDGEPLGLDVPAVVPLAVWLENAAAWRAAGIQRGVWLVGDEDVEPLAGQLDGLSLIAIAFPSFNDGRGFSTARRVRRLGWQGELRAVGDVLIDTVNYLARCGFDSFQLKPGHDPEVARQQLQLFSQPYQRGYRPLVEA